MAVSNLQPATPDTAGIVASHIRDIHWACRQNNTFLFVRPSTVPTMRLIEAGFATKSMDIHDKSSDWGLTSGLVPVDQAFCKNLTGTPNPHIHPHGHGKAQAVHLNLQGTFDKLNAQRHFEHMQEVQTGPCAGDTGRYRHFHCDTKNAKVCFLMERLTGLVFWRWREAPSGEPVRLYVWGYGGTPVTGDYDMWMVVPYVKALGGDKNINSNKDHHGRSAASNFTTTFMAKLNVACNRVDKPVFNHGAEAQNVSFTQAMDRRLVVFTPGSMKPFMFPRILMPGMLHDLLLHGYIVVRNPKWLSGTTLGIEDMADAADQFPDDGSVKAGVGAVNKLKKSVLLELLSRKNKERFKSDGVWNERYAQLRYFRAMGKMPNERDAPETLILPPEAFPPYGEGSKVDLSGDVRKLGEEIETNFKRQGFLKEDGHLSPVDSSKPQSQNKLGTYSVGSLINQFGGR